jgi:hypothetical protein
MGQFIGKGFSFALPGAVGMGTAKFPAVDINA